MKKHLQFFIKKETLTTLLFIAFAIGVNAQISTFPWTETFDDDSPSIAGWTQIYEVGDMSWTFTNDASTGSYGLTAYDGTNFANFPGDSFDGETTKLVSPVLDLAGIEIPTLSFYYVNPLWSPDQNWLRVYYRTSETGDWTLIAEYHDDVDEWTSTGELSIPSDTYQIALECETEYGYSTLVDHLVVTGNMGVAEVSTISKAVIEYYPNPAQDFVNFKSNELVTDLEIYNTMGQLVKRIDLDALEGEINVSSLKAGIYFVRANTEKGVNSFKLVKK